MKAKDAAIDPKKTYAAQSARLGLITVSDLSLLTGVAVAQLTSFAKKGHLRSYAEYHGKRFYNFAEIVSWIGDEAEENEAKSVIRATMMTEVQNADCPYALEKDAAAGTETPVRLVWKEFVEEAAA